ncbi:MAG: hypothetical protein J0I14_08535 [Propionibacteriaceae bacterium]|nr:hypothetical protein [Propionibacteriaceae bacterium]
MAGREYGSDSQGSGPAGQGRQGLQQFPIIATAALAGSVLPAQAGAITGVLADLPQEFDDQTVVEAPEMMVGFAEAHNSSELRHLTSYLVERLSPETADQLEAKRLERQERRAPNHRFLEFTNNGEGSVLIRDSLPVASAEPLIQIIEAYAAAEKRRCIDPSTRWPNPSHPPCAGPTGYSPWLPPTPDKLWHQPTVETVPGS